MDNPKCIIEGCERQQEQRGVCVACRAHLSDAIYRGEITEDDLVANGLLLPRKIAAHRPKVTHVSIAIAKLKGNQ